MQSCSHKLGSQVIFLIHVNVVCVSRWCVCARVCACMHACVCVHVCAGSRALVCLSMWRPEANCGCFSQLLSTFILLLIDWFGGWLVGWLVG